jgi:hypothetical protein
LLAAAVLDGNLVVAVVLAVIGLLFLERTQVAELVLNPH